MHRSRRIKLDAARRALAFLLAATLLPAAALAARDRLEELLRRVGELFNQQLLARQEISAARHRRKQLVPELRDRCLSLIRLVNAVAHDHQQPGLHTPSRRLCGVAIDRFLAEVADLLTRAAAAQDVLVEAGMPPALLRELRQAHRRATEANDRITAANAVLTRTGAELEAIAAGLRPFFKRLDGILELHFTDRDWLAQWNAVRSCRWGRESAAEPAQPTV